jgi:hypothetical protein
MTFRINSASYFYYHCRIIFLTSIFLFLTGFFSNVKAITKSSVSTGNWDNPLVWTPAGIPGSNDNVLVLSNHIITINNNAEINAVKIDADGELNFLSGKDLIMHSNLTVDGKVSMNGGNIHFNGGDFVLNANATFIWEPGDNTLAGASLFTNGTEFFDASSNLIIKKWFDYSGVPLGSVVTGDFGNITLNSLYNGFLYEWNQNNQFETHKISGTLTVDQGWIVLDKSGNISNTTIGNIVLLTPNAFLDFHSGTHNSSFTVNTQNITNTGGNLNGIYNGNGNVTLNVTGSFYNLGNFTLIYNTGVLGVGNGTAVLNVDGNFNQLAGDFRAIFNLTTTNAGVSNLTFNTINLTGGIMMGQYACHTSSATCNFKVNGDFNINFSKPTDKFRVIGLTSLSGTYNNAKSNFIVNGSLLIAGNAYAEFTSSGSVGAETVTLGKLNAGGCTNNFNLGSHQVVFNSNGNLEISGGTTSLSKSPGNATINISGDFIQTAGTLSLKGNTGSADATIAGNFSLSGGTILLHSNINSTSVNPVNLTINGNFSQSGGTFNFDDNASGTAINSLFIKGPQYNLTGSGSITRSGNGTSQNSGNLVFARAGTIDFQRTASYHNIQQVKQNVSSGCTLNILSGNLQISSSTTQTTDQLKISADGILKMNLLKIISNNQYSYSGITVENNGRIKLQHLNGLYNGTDNACISSAGNMDFFLAPNSIVEYNGNNSQVLTGTGIGNATTNNHKYGKLEINFQGIPNAANVYLTKSNVFVRMALILTQGELKLNNNTLTIESGLTTAITRSTGYINSENNLPNNQSCIKWMNISYGNHVFPFGINKVDYIPFSFTPVSGSGSVTVSTRATGSDNTPFPNGGNIPAVTSIKRNGIDISTSSVIDRWYDIIATGFKANITASYRGAENTTSDSIADATFSFQAWDGVSWSHSMGSTVGVRSGIGTVTASNVTSFGHLMIATTTDDSDLDEDLNFEAELKNSIVETRWSVSSSNNTGYYSVERSADQVLFTALHLVSAETSLSYLYNDNAILNGISYYRLKHVNSENRTSYSRNEIINNPDNSAGQFSITTIYPNPFGDFIKITFTSPDDLATTLTLSGLSGQIITSEEIQTSIGTNSYKLSGKGNLLPGVYVLTLTNNNKAISQKIFKS